jgi:hypothetical protein
MTPERSVRHGLQAWNATHFLYTGGIVLVLLGWAGITGVLGHISDRVFFHPPGWVNWMHLSVGTAVLAVALFSPRGLKIALACVPAVLATAIGLGGLVLGLGTALRAGRGASFDASDALAHLAVGALAIWSLYNGTRQGVRGAGAL